MISESITCPHCGRSIPLSEAISREVDSKLHDELHLREDKLLKKYQADIAAVWNNVNAGVIQFDTL